LGPSAVWLSGGLRFVGLDPCRPCAAISDGYLVNPIADIVVHEANRLRFPMAVPDAPAALVMSLMCWPIGRLTVFFASVALFGAWRGRARA
jgi:hypothetical protein